jgi:hypothetical protein
MAQAVSIPADQQVLTAALPDFDVCLLDRSLSVTDGMLSSGHLKRLIRGHDPAAMLRELREWLEGMRDEAGDASGTPDGCL